jgi:hypothetical protein
MYVAHEARPMWPMYGTYIAILLGLAQVNESQILAIGTNTALKYNLWMHTGTNCSIETMRITTLPNSI